MKLLLLSLIVLLSACKETQVDADVGLYDPIPPAGSAFVRFINLTDGEYKPAISGKNYPVLSAGKISPYYVTPKGNAKFSDELVQDIVPGRFYTLVKKDEYKFIQDKSNDNPMKATIAVYNFTAEPLTLKARQGSVDIITDVPVKSMGSRDINAVKIDFSVYQNGKLTSNIDQKILERGNHYSFIFDGKKIRFVTATTNTRE